MHASKLTIFDSLNAWRPRIDHPIIITDSRVEKLYGEKLAQQLNCGLISVPCGEGSKGIETYYEVVQKLTQHQCTRQTTLIALGGGVVGDLAGFAAATFMRGIPLIQIPTTLLAMVDSSIGGKTGINLPEGKNLLGAFYIPKETVIAIELLKTLPREEIRSGLSEVIKYGIILDAALFNWLEETIEDLLKKELKALKIAVARCAKLKTEVVKQDPKEHGLRLILNYGHTFGHALELLTGYKQYTHGEAVALGMDFEGELAKRRTGFSNEELSRQSALLKKVHSHLRFPFIEGEKLTAAMLADKKRTDKEIVFALPEKIGTMAKEKGEFRIAISQKAIHESLHTHYSAHCC